MAAACRVRFAPSPTGQLHLGSLRTALFNFLLARRNSGKFALRIEDTDRERLVPGCVEKYENILDIYGLHRDEGPQQGGPFGPYLQSKRLDLYKRHANQLVEEGRAYHCFCSEERLDILRRNAAHEKTNIKYDNRCRTLQKSEVSSRLANGETCVIRLKFEDGPVRFHDTVFLENIQSLDEGDFIIMKTDSYPTYHFANVVDDHLMEISHVVRGAEWLSSTPKHVKLYEAFGWQAPVWVHIPLITRGGAKKLSKRDADALVEYYDVEEGYLSLGILNYLLRNGSGIKDYDPTRLYSLQELIDSFDETLIGRRSFMMDNTPLKKFGRLAFRAADFEKDLLPAILRRIAREFPDGIDRSLLTPEYIRRVVNFLRSNEEAFYKLADLTSGTFRFFFFRPKCATKILEMFPREQAITLLEKVHKLYPHGWSKECLADVCKEDLEIASFGDSVSFQKLMVLIRLAVIGNASGPTMPELIEFFTPEEISARFKQAILLVKES